MVEKYKISTEELIFDIESNAEISKVTHLSINNKPEICSYLLFYKALTHPDLAIPMQIKGLWIIL